MQPILLFNGFQPILILQPLIISFTSGQAVITGVAEGTTEVYAISDKSNRIESFNDYG